MPVLPSVDDFMKALDHPLKKQIEQARKIILGADPSIEEGIKWNAPSYRTAEYFATINLRSKEAVQFVFHRGAKSKSGGKTMNIADPKGLLQWITSDRCLVTLGAGPDIAANRKVFESIIKAWIKQL